MIYNIADWKVGIHNANGDEEAVRSLLPSFAPFGVAESSCPGLFTLTIDQQLEVEQGAAHIRVCETGNGDISVDRLANGGYQYLIKNLRGESCALLHSSSDFSQYRCRMLSADDAVNAFGLNNALMLAYAFAGAQHGTLLIHASLVRHRGRAYAFIAQSGTGKSTQTANWIKMIPECDLMNDDNPVVRVVDGKAVAYGSPWSGKTPCYRQVMAPIGAIAKIARDPENYVTPMHPITAFSELLISCSVMKWDNATYRGVCDTVSAVVERVPMYVLHCTAAPESAIVCHKSIAAEP